MNETDLDIIYNLINFVKIKHMYLNHKYEFRLICFNTVKTLSFESEDDKSDLVKDIENAFERLNLVEGGNIRGIFQKTEETDIIMQELEDKYDKKTNKSIRSLTRFFYKKVKIGEFFIRQMTWAPIPDQIRSYNIIYAFKKGLNHHEEDMKFTQTWLWLYCMFEIYSYGWCDDDIYVGKDTSGQRVCRFCNNIADDKFTKIAHAISESLGNKHLFCNEECDECNSRLAQTEDHFLRLMDIRRSLFKISGKGSSCHCVEGYNFVIRPNKQNNPIIYLKEEMLPEGIDTSRNFPIQLLHKWATINECIYQAVVKYVMDLLPSEEMSNFYQTIEWLNNKMGADELPPMLFGMHDRMFRQPVLDIFVNSKKNLRDIPYCTAVLYSCDIAYMFVVPFCSKDNGIFKTRESLFDHFKMMMERNHIVKTWTWQSTHEYWKGTPWSSWNLEPGKYEIRKSEDPVFELHKKNVKKSISQKPFPKICTIGGVSILLKDVSFQVRTSRAVDVTELRNVSINLHSNKFVVLDDKHTEFEFWVSVADTENKEVFFEYKFVADFEVTGNFSNFYSIDEDKYLSLDSHLIDMMYNSAFNAAELVMKEKRKNTSFEVCTVTKLLDQKFRRLLLNFDFKKNNSSTCFTFGA